MAGKKSKGAQKKSQKSVASTPKKHEGQSKQKKKSGIADESKSVSLPKQEPLPTAPPQENAPDSWEEEADKQGQEPPLKVNRQTGEDDNRDENESEELDDSSSKPTEREEEVEKDWQTSPMPTKRSGQEKTYETNKKEEYSNWSKSKSGSSHEKVSSQKWPSYENINNDRRTEDQAFYDFEKNWRKIKDFKKVHEKEGDLFAMPREYSLAHCVAEDLNMGSGIATTFRQQFKNLGELYSQKARQGGLTFLQDKERYVYYLVTKRASAGKPTYETMWRSLQCLHEKMKEHGVTKLAIPRIGCGLDRLEWDQVKAMLEMIFADSPVEIVVCNFQQPEYSATPQSSNFASKKSWQPGRKCQIVNVTNSLSDMEQYTAIIYLCAEDGTVTDTMNELDKKHPFLQRSYLRETRRTGVAIVTSFAKYILYGFVVRKAKNRPLDFVEFEKCARQLQRENKKAPYPYEFVALEAFDDDKDDLLLSKLLNILRCTLTNVDIYVCWPENLKHLMPLNEKPQTQY